MKTLKILWTISILFTQVLVCLAQVDELIKSEYWPPKQIWLNKDIQQRYISKQLGEKPKYPFEAIVLDSTTIYMALIGSEYVYTMAKTTPETNLYRLPFQEWDAPVYHDKKYFLKMESDSLILSIHDSQQHIDTLVFMKPDPRLKHKSLNVVMMSYLLSGDYTVTYSDNPSQQDKVTFSLDSRILGLDSIARWEFGHLFGVEKPYKKGLSGVLKLTGLANKNYYAILQVPDKSWLFYNYTRDQRSIYHLSEKPEIILRYITDEK